MFPDNLEVHAGRLTSKEQQFLKFLKLRTRLTNEGRMIPPAAGGVALVFSIASLANAVSFHRCLRRECLPG